VPGEYGLRRARSPTLVVVTKVGEFDVSRRELPGRGTVLQVEGELDMATAPALEDALADAGFAERLVIDLTACTFVDSSAVRVLVSSARDSEAASGSLALVVADPGILRVLEISGVDTMLPVHETLDAAL
jgi:anti-sigma B factor antagonist